MLQRIRIAGAMVAALTGTAAAQTPDIFISNQLVREFPNAGGGLGSLQGHYVITMDVPIKKANWADLKDAIEKNDKARAKNSVGDPDGRKHTALTTRVVDAVLDELAAIGIRGLPPDVDIQTIEDVAVGGTRAVPGRKPAKYLFRLHLDVPISTRLEELQTHLTTPDGCKAKDVVKANIASGNDSGIVRTFVLSALGCATW